MKKMNYTKVLIKLHFFFYLGSAGPTFPFLYVYGKQIGISPIVIGSIGAILPILHLVAKPIFGFIIDYFQTCRKFFFLSLLVIANSCYIMIFLLPPLPGLMSSEYHFQNISCLPLPHCNMDNHESAIRLNNKTEDITCHWICKNTNFSIRMLLYANQTRQTISLNTTCLLNINETLLCQRNVTNNDCNITCDRFDNDKCLYSSITFWSFVLLMCLGETGFFVFIGLSDTICFAILGENNQLKYGKQRVWGTIGFGAAAFLAGYTVDLLSQEEAYKSYIPSIFIAVTFTCIDIICCIKLKVPFKLKSTTIVKDVFTLIKSKSVVIFLCFVTIFGILNGIIRNFLFWYVEDLAVETGYISNIKLIEGLIIAIQTFGGEIVFLFFSGKILEKLGYDYTFIFCLICFALRLGLISLSPTPWWILSIEFLNGPTCALCLTLIVAYASVIAPPGASATFQGLVQGFTDGFGISAGSFIGGILYKKFGGLITLRIFSVFALFSAFIYFVLYVLYLKHKISDTRNNVKWRQPDDAQNHCVIADT
ncbi:major facilitator superfamily domain-containing protein 6-A-like [Cardiocondyla obscurior]|uniref:major facilitator superfamily domain-containing protein 6-A-like n=1 Tax=Cardiocondyla obscurior TaxID=286306 RepID=UPI003965774E